MIFIYTMPVAVFIIQPPGINLINAQYNNTEFKIYYSVTKGHLPFQPTHSNRMAY